MDKVEKETGRGKEEEKEEREREGGVEEGGKTAISPQLTPFTLSVFFTLYLRSVLY